MASKRCRYCHKLLASVNNKKRHESKCQHQYGDGDDHMETGYPGIYYTEKQIKDMDAQEGDEEEEEEDDDGVDSDDKDSDKDGDDGDSTDEDDDDMYKSKIWHRLLKEALSTMDLSDVKSAKDILDNHFDDLQKKLVESIEGYNSTWRKIKESTMYENINETINGLEEKHSYGRKEAVRSGWDQRKHLVKMFIEHNMDIVDEALKGDDDDDASEGGDSKHSDGDEEEEDDEEGEGGKGEENEDAKSESGEGEDGEMKSEDSDDEEEETAIVSGLAQNYYYPQSTQYGNMLTITQAYPNLNK